ncbi:uncharacterized protein TNCV_274041 [Trichonephila clavipes]|nr:uncharacterized protein TNCV_274041 [Trichonephila clavipes]
MQFEKTRIITMMEDGWSARRVARQLHHYDCVVRQCWDHCIPKDVIYTKTRPMTLSTHQSSRRPPHRKKCRCSANWFIGNHPGTSSTFNRGPCVFSDHTKDIWDLSARYMCCI